MVRTQIQLPDKMYSQLKMLAQNEETTLAEIIRRASSYLLQTQPVQSDFSSVWTSPIPEDLGEFISIEEEWRLKANE